MEKGGGARRESEKAKTKKKHQRECLSTGHARVLRNVVYVVGERDRQADRQGHRGERRDTASVRETEEAAKRTKDKRLLQRKGKKRQCSVATHKSTEDEKKVERETRGGTPTQKGGRGE